MNGEMRAAVDFLYDLPRFTQKNSLAHTRRVMELLGDPCAGRKVIHVAGSNGKGSVCNFLYHMLLAAESTAGMFTSPHLTDIRERFQINGKLVSEEAFLAAYDRVGEAVRSLRAQGGSHPTFFEFVYCMAMCLFEEADVAYVILETGLGGRLDATNSFPAPLLSVITPIALEHTEILGDSIERIAAEKAGILKPGVPVVFAAGMAPGGATADAAKDAGPTEPRAADAAADIIAERAHMLCCPTLRVNAGRSVTSASVDFERSVQIKEIGADEIAFSLRSDHDKETIWHLPGRALYQVQNAALAVTAMQALRDATDIVYPAAHDVRRQPTQSIKVPRPEDTAAGTGAMCDAVLQRGLFHAVWPGRMQEVLPDVFFDGAHNPAGIDAFLASVREMTRNDPLAPLLLFAMMEEKDIAASAALLQHGMHWDAVAVTSVPGERGADPVMLAAAFSQADRSTDTRSGRAEAFADPQAAFDAMRSRRRDGQKLFCTGSLHFLGDLLQRLQ